MTKISANTVFHFTNIDALAGILQNGFYPSYSIEEYLTEDGPPFRLAFPMVCFCDIPLSQIADHIDQYGKYGIGVSKKWAIRKKLNPVLYLEKSSLLWRRFESVLDQNYKDVVELGKLEVKVDSMIRDRDSLMYMFMHTKPYEGFYNRNGEQRYKRFYDEREWRYVPDLKRIDRDELFLSQNMLSEDVIKKKNAILREHSLTFDPADIQYLILERESERMEMFSMLSELGSEKYGEGEIKILSSRIISAEQIKNDI